MVCALSFVVRFALHVHVKRIYGRSSESDGSDGTKRATVEPDRRTVELPSFVPHTRDPDTASESPSSPAKLVCWLDVIGST